MIKKIKIGNLIYTNIQPKTIDENGQEIWNIPNDLEELRSCTIDTFNWLIGQEVKKASGGDFTKLSAANSKAIVLLVKVLGDNADTSNLTDREKESFEKLKVLGDIGYSDSDLLLNSLNAVTDNIQAYSQKINKALKATSIDELIELLEQ